MNKMIIAVMVVVMTTGCKKFVDIDAPIDKINTTVAFENDESAKSAVLGIYSQMMITTPMIGSGGVTIYTGLSSDELDYTGTTAAISEFRNNSLTTSNTYVSNDFWQRAYSYIYHINAVIEGIAVSKEMSATARTQLTAEAMFMRAYMYYYLANLFGDVPLVTGTNYATNIQLARTPVTEVFKQITGDLIYARQYLPAQYSGFVRTRPNKYAATALLARVYLQLQRWDEAEAMATEVIASGGYTLVANPDLVFNANSTEAILQLVPVASNFNTTEGSSFIPSSATTRPNYVLTPNLLAAFETGDKRKASWTKTVTVSSQQYTHPFKYKIRSGTTVTEYYMLLRLAEQYLIRAEARAEQGKLTEAKADLNMIRTRAGLANTIAVTKDDILAATEKERRIELLAEWGHRWIDLKRRNRADAVLQPLKSGWQPHDVLYPVPQSQIQLNPLLTQNAGY